MKKFKYKLGQFIMTCLIICLGISTFAQWTGAGSVDTTFAPNNNSVPFSLNGTLKSQGVEIIGNSVYYAYQTYAGYPKIRKYDFLGNEDQSYFNNQMSTWSGQFSTFYLESERDQTGIETGKFFISGRNSHNWGVNQGVRFLNKINEDGTRDTDFVCPYTSWISICSAIYHDWENDKLYYSFQTGMPGSYSQTIVCCNPNTGQVLQTVQLPSPTGLISRITKIPGTNELICGGSFNFSFGGHTYIGVFKLDEQMTITPIEGITDLTNSMSVNDIIFVSGSECDGVNAELTSYFCGSVSTASGVSGFRNLVRYKIQDGTWIVDPIFNPGCPGTITDICFYNCNLIATGNFASSTSQQVYEPTWTPKVTAFTVDGQINEEFKTINIGAGLGGINTSGFENNWGQGTGTCLAVNSTEDGNNNWEIFVGGTFISWIQFDPLKTILRKQNFMAKLHGFENSVDPNFDYCIEQVSSDKYSISATNIKSTTGCEKWELFLSEELPFNWNLIRTENTSNFEDNNLYVNKWYKIVRTVTECGNTSTNTYIVHKETVRNTPDLNQVELRSIEFEQPIKGVKLDEKSNEELVVYPNPSSGHIYITDKSKNINRNVCVYNTMGIKVLNYQFLSNTYDIDLSELPSGVYMVVVTTQDGVRKKQVIKE